jgi:hypothetical protein
MAPSGGLPLADVLGADVIWPKKANCLKLAVKDVERSACRVHA